ncbi:MAG: hypothetical protein KAG18_03535, partial [Sinobacterium sp.]|nr:hypothetical protein [Sinobacterium sp.]
YTNADNHTGDSLAKQTMQSVSELFNTGKTKRQSRAQAVLAAEEAKVADAAESATDEQLDPQSTVLPYQHYCIQLDTLLVIIDPSYYQTSTGGGESSVLAFDDAGQKNIVRFLRDIYSLTFKKNSNRLCLNTFSWPPHQALPGHIQQAQMAYSMQQSFLETLSQTQHFDYALVFSEGYVGALFGEEEKQTLAHGYLSKLQGVNTLKVGSLQSYWKNSQLKNDLWSSLQALTHASEI